MKSDIFFFIMYRNVIQCMFDHLRLFLIANHNVIQEKIHSNRSRMMIKKIHNITHFELYSLWTASIIGVAFPRFNEVYHANNIKINL